MGTCTVQNVIRHTTKKCMHTHAFYCKCTSMKLEVFDGYRSAALSFPVFQGESLGPRLQALTLFHKQFYDTATQLTSMHVQAKCLLSS